MCKRDADCIRHLHRHHRRRPQINIWWRLVVLISDLTEIVYYMGFTCWDTCKGVLYCHPDLRTSGRVCFRRKDPLLEGQIKRKSTRL